MDRRTHYVDTTLRLFVEHGYNGVSMDQLVAEAGGSKATLYRYFASKRDLFLAIIDDLSTKMLPANLSDVANKPIDEALFALGSRIAAAALSDRATILTRLAAGEAQRFPELGRMLFEHGPGRSYAQFAQLVRARVALGELSVDDPDIAAEQFIAGIVGHQQMRMTLGVSAPSADEIEARVYAAVKTFLAAYGVESSGASP